MKNNQPQFKCPYSNGERYISRWSQSSMNGKVQMVTVTWSDGEMKTFMAGDKDVPQDVRDRCPGVFEGPSAGDSGENKGNKSDRKKKKEEEKKKKEEEKKRKKEEKKRSKANKVEPEKVKEEEAKINDRDKIMNQPSMPNKETKKEVEIDYGVHVDNIEPEDPGSLVFKSEGGNQKQIFSDGKNALGSSNWEKMHRAMKGDFYDKDFDLKDKKKTLYGIKG